jgi:ABC-type multidrug transport system fused ATPase/permease subunit
LYDIPADTVFLDGQDITRIDTGLLRSAIVFMPQVNFLFSTTIRHNIAFGQPELLQTGAQANPSDTTAEPSILEAAEVASVHLDVQGLPRQYQTLVGERGVMLSGGQRQRVALARSILMDSPVLILDDPFSNVDAETERNIVSALRARRVFRDRTTLIATHRFSLLSLCDRVVLMNEGRILAVGTPEELLATQPLYQKLYRLQELRTTLGDWGLEPELNSKTNDNTLDSDTNSDDEDALVEVGEEG